MSSLIDPGPRPEHDLETLGRAPDRQNGWLSRAKRSVGDDPPQLSTTSTRGLVGLVEDPVEAATHIDGMLIVGEVRER
jgi:hypothetical protein